MSFLPLTVEKLLLFMAKQSPTEEICGVISSDFTIYPIENIARDKSYTFILNPKEYALACNNIKRCGEYVLCIYHSHINGDTALSPQDMKTLKMTNLAMLVIGNTLEMHGATDASK